MPGVAGAGVAEDLAVDRDPPGQGVLALLEHEHPGPLAEDEAVAVEVERPAGAGRLVVPPRGRDLHQVEARHDARGDRGVGAAGHDQGRLAVLDAAEGIADRVGARGAPGRDDVRRPAQAEPDRDLRRAVAVRAGREGEDVGPLGPPRVVVGVHRLDEFGPAPARAEQDADLPARLQVEPLGGQPRVLQRLARGEDRQRDHPADPLQLPGLHRPGQVDPPDRRRPPGSAGARCRTPRSDGRR